MKLAKLLSLFVFAAICKSGAAHNILFIGQNGSEAMLASEQYDLRLISPARNTIHQIATNLQKADAAIVDITPHPLSPNLDGDRAWIIGYAMAMKKPVYLYTLTPVKFTDRLREAFTSRGRDHFRRENKGFKRLMDPDGYAIEEFNLWDNLMIDGAAHYSLGTVQSSIEDAFRLAASLLGKTERLRTGMPAGPTIASINKNIYLAGPDVFLDEPLRAARLKKKIARQMGFRGLFPLDNEVEFVLPVEEFAMRIFYANIQTMFNSEIVVANMTPFRGNDMDQGTAFEQGFMFGLGRCVYGYSTLGKQNVSTLGLESVRRCGGRLEKSFAAAVAHIKSSRYLEEEKSIGFCQSLLTIEDL